MKEILNKRLSLNKQTIASLNGTQMQNIVGGLDGETDICDTVNGCRPPRRHLPTGADTCALCGGGGLSGEVCDPTIRTDNP